MLKHLTEVDSLGWVDCQTPANEVFGVISDCDVLWEGEGASSDLFVSLLDLLRFEGWSTVEHRVEDNSDGPVVYLVTVATVSL